MKITLLGYYSFFIGVCILGMWMMILFKGIIPEGKTEITFHLVSEFLMAGICILSGIMLLFRKRNGRILCIAGLSMVIYSVLNAAGYYGERHETPMVILFILLLFMTLWALYIALTIPETVPAG